MSFEHFFSFASLLISLILAHDTLHSQCHSDGPAYAALSCDSSSHQIISCADRTTEQKENLIIFDMDFTILESEHGFHQAVPTKHRRHTQTTSDFNLISKREILFINQPDAFSVIFRNHFFELLKYIHSDIGFSADIVIYGNARPTYAKQVSQAIIQCFKTKYPNITIADASFFKMVISNPAISRTQAKTISTLEPCLDISQYETVIILDNDGPNNWCRHEIIKKIETTDVRFLLIKVPEFSVWRSVYRQYSIFAAKRDLPKSDAGIAQFFYSMISAFQGRDKFFVQFEEFLHASFQNNTRVFHKYADRLLPVSRKGVMEAKNWRYWPK